MKLLRFLPVLFLLFFAACGNEKEVVKPAETAENNLRGPSCPFSEAYFDDADEVLESHFNCLQAELQACSALGQTITFYNHPYPLAPNSIGNGGYISKYHYFSAAELQAIYNDAVAQAEANKPVADVCNGGIVRYTLDFSTLTCSNCADGSIRVKATYYCCTL